MLPSGCLPRPWHAWVKQQPLLSSWTPQLCHWPPRGPLEFPLFCDLQCNILPVTTDNAKNVISKLQLKHGGILSDNA